MPERNVKRRTGGLEPGGNAPDFSLPRDGGGTVALKDFAGKARVSVDGHAEAVLTAVKAL